VVQVQELFADMPVSIIGDDVPISAISADSRQVSAGTLFAALRGEESDGHQFISAACDQGASAILCEHEQEGITSTQIVTKNSKQTLAQIARRFYQQPDEKLTMVGITGTNGKTTSTCLIAHILSFAKKKVGQIGTLGCRWAGKEMHSGLTTPDALYLAKTLRAMVDDDIECAVLEVSSHALEQHRVSGTSFDIAIFTNLSHDHLDYHKDMEAYFIAKRRLFDERLKNNATCLINIDDVWGRKLNIEGALSYALDNRQADFYVESMRMSADGMHAQVHTPQGRFEFESPLIGRFNLYNMVAALAVAQTLHIPNETIREALLEAPQIPGRMQRVNRDGEPLVLIDYAHTPDALEKALKTISEISTGKLYCVFGCGGDRDQAKRPQMGRIVSGSADKAWITNDNPRSEEPMAIAREIEEGFEEAGAKKGSAYHIVLDRRLAIMEAIAAAKSEDIVLIAGKGHESIQTIAGEKLTFDDASEARNGLDVWAKPN